MQGFVTEYAVVSKEHMGQGLNSLNGLYTKDFFRGVS